MPSYNPKAIETKWQRNWEANKTFRTPNTSDKPKYYILDMFPYPSGAGLHVGHPEGYTATDILARYKRMCGFNVPHPMGWDAFGLPAEQYAIETMTHPRITTQRNIHEFRRQIKMLGFSYDWDREIDTTNPNYFQWTQWIFLVLYDTWYDKAQKRGRPIAELPIPQEIKSRGEAAIRNYQNSKRLAYQAEVPVNWCEALGTVLANEEVVDGKSERGDHPVVRMPLRQWLLRITDYADRLLEDLALVQWPDSIKKQQSDWIGRSEGAEADFALSTPGTPRLTIFTTRPDTLFGATYMVLAPEHALVDSVTTPQQRAQVKAYQAETARKSDLERTDLAKKKTGVFTGGYAINPVNNESIPIWIADYVLISYGTGAIMAVPAHDLRDWEFARAFNLPIRQVVRPPKGYQPTREEAALAYAEDGRTCLPFVGEGTAIHSGPFTGLNSAEFKEKITAWLEERGLGARKVNFKLRDWLFSRQRYWGEPFPILHEVDDAGRPTGVVRPLSTNELPLTLPDLEDYRPTGKPEPPLEKANDWVSVARDGKRYKRETNTMPQWAGSCWYYLRFIDPQNSKALCDPAREKYWQPVDLYVGGAEHAVLHLLYSRFWHKVLFDRGHVHSPEPFLKLINQGMVLGDTDFHVAPEVYEANQALIDKMGLRVFRFKDDDKEICVLRNPSNEPDRYSPLTEEQVVKERGRTLLKGTGIELVGRAEKMSKSRGNVVNPDEVVDQYGADSLRLYEMFMGPLEAVKPWSMRGVDGVYRFLGRVWRLLIDDRADEVKLTEAVQDTTADRDTLRKLHLTMQKVTEDLEAMRFNTAIAALMEFSNHLTPLHSRPRSVLQTFILLLAPFAPHLAEELWSALGHQTTLAYEQWPKYDPALTKADAVEVPVQVNGKLRSRIIVPAGIDSEQLKAAALADERIRALIGGKEPHKMIVVPGKLVNIVVG